MANRKKKETTDDVWLNIGNYKVSIQEDGKGRFLVCTDEVGLWSVTWREGSRQFVDMAQLIYEYAQSGEDVLREYASTVICFYYYCTTHFFSIEYMEEYNRWFEECAARINPMVDVSEEEEEGILQEETDRCEVEEELERLDGHEVH